MMSCTRKRSLSQIYTLANPDVVLEETGPKSGKWSAEEEMFANKLIAQFEAGTLTDCAEGSTLRSYLARKLNCAPMRISKKFAGQCIGKHTFTKKEPCVAPVTDRDLLSETSTLTRSPAALADEPQDFMWEDAIDIMSFDSFTDFQGCQDVYRSSSNAVGANIWSNTVEIIPESDFYPPQKRQLVSSFETTYLSNDVGLDLDNMYSSCNAAEVIPPECARVAPVPGPVAELPMKKDWGLRCTIPQYEYRPRSPSSMVPSGAAVVTPTNAAGDDAGTSSAASPCQPVAASASVPTAAQPEYEQCKKFDACLQYEQCKQFNACPPQQPAQSKKCDASTQTTFSDADAMEAAEWRDVLDYFCGPHAVYC